MPGLRKEPVIPLDDEDFGTILNCAVRYSIGRRAYMPDIVVGFITPLLPFLSSKTVYVFDQDVTRQRYEGGYGDPLVDEPCWVQFLGTVHAEEARRGIEPYKDWRDNNGTGVPDLP